MSSFRVRGTPGAVGINLSAYNEYSFNTTVLMHASISIKCMNLVDYNFNHNLELYIVPVLVQRIAMHGS